MKLKVAVLAVAAFGISFAKNNAAMADSSQDAVERAQSKLQHIEKNAELAHPDPMPTEFTEQEINAYFAAGKVKLPDGVQSVTFQGQPGVVTASCHVDFDRVKAGRMSANPLLALFSGVHDVVVIAQAAGVDRQGVVSVQSVSFDGVEIPRFVLELFVEKYLRPKYPNVGLQSRFALADKIDTAIVGEHKLSITQR
jgi:hypothetical protein